MHIPIRCHDDGLIPPSVSSTEQFWKKKVSDSHHLVPQLSSELRQARVKAQIHVAVSLSASPSDCLQLPTQLSSHLCSVCVFPSVLHWQLGFLFCNCNIPPLSVSHTDAHRSIMMLTFNSLAWYDSISKALGRLIKGCN